MSPGRGALGSLLAIARAGEGLLDDPDPAFQRPGILDLGALPEPAPPAASALPTPGRKTVIFFVRPAQLGDVCTAIADDGLAGLADLVVVVAGEAEPCRTRATLISHPERAVAEAQRVRPSGRRTSGRLRGGGPEGRIRYRTLDPEVDDQLGEVKTILEATQ